MQEDTTLCLAKKGQGASDYLLLLFRFFYITDKEKTFFFLFFARFALPFSLTKKVLSFENKKKNLFSFCVFLTYSYLCRR